MRFKRFVTIGLVLLLSGCTMSITLGCAQGGGSTQLPPVVLPPPEIPVADSPISYGDYQQMKVGSVGSLVIEQFFGPPPLSIPQPNGGVAFRYQVLDKDGQYRGKHVYFVFGSDGVLRRKSRF